MSLKQLTIKLFNECEECLNRHKRMREEDRSPDFFGEVKPHVDHFHAKIDEWEKQSKEWIASYRPKHVRVQQIDHAVDMMKQFLVQSFYKETGKKRFVQSIQAVQYTLETLLRAIREEGEDDQK
ncbi:YppE family protein [Chungangia koreensis]